MLPNPGARSTRGCPLVRSKEKSRGSSDRVGASTSTGTHTPADLDTTAPKQMKVTVGVTVGLEAEGTG
ncbi:Ubiquitin Carboxyl-Terminal Hydrolase 42 [Manis pentadactyla]|nr:Ubiquitin Carboxyl-Terminal Hydrolase 42 [Manis pentadactyla]